MNEKEKQKKAKEKLLLEIKLEAVMKSKIIDCFFDIKKKFIELSLKEHFRGSYIIHIKTGANKFELVYTDYNKALIDFKRLIEKQEEEC